MSDWKDWDKLLGPGKETESSGGSSAKDPKGREGTIVIRRRTRKNGRAIFEVFLKPQPANFAPTGAEVVSLEVEGFKEADCTGRKVCAQFAPIPAGKSLLKLVPGSAFTFEPSDHDGGLLNSLLNKCDCGVKGVQSYKIYVEVKITPEPKPPKNLRFSICYPCGLIEE
ncbi:MAG TPA: hypothetical protein VE969_03570 [Pyrinomonadaceae bacterium]|nr:hypothetical protein [Pyrinomonadaceae bacterium]